MSRPICCKTVLILTMLFRDGWSTQQVLLTCSSNEMNERGPAGSPGEKGAKGIAGEKGEKGMKGERGQSDDSTESIKLLQERIVELENDFYNKLGNLTIDKVITNSSNCDDLYEEGVTIDGFYNIAVDGKVLEVYCEFQRAGHNWMIFQKRFSGEIDFFRNWKNYVEGFGQKSGEFWLGLKHLHAVLSTGQYMLRVDIEDWEGNKAYAEYRSFAIGDESTNYRLSVGGFSGTAGNALVHHNNQQFSTKERDNDDHPSVNCAASYLGGWWYRECHTANLNGKYLKGGQVNDEGLSWRLWKGTHYSMKKSEMKIRPMI